MKIPVEPLSSAVREFSGFCGPRALAAVTGLDPDTAAGLLIGVQRARGHELYRTGRAKAADLDLALIELGYRVESWLSTNPPKRIGDVERAEAERPVASTASVPRTEIEALHEGVLRGREPLRFGTVKLSGTWLIHGPDHVCAHRDGTTLNVIEPTDPICTIRRIIYPQEAPCRT